MRALRRMAWIAAAVVGVLLARMGRTQMLATPAPLEPATARVCLWGDSQNGTPVFRTIVAAMAVERPDYLLTTGDVIENRGAIPSEWVDQFLAPLAPLLHLPRLGCLGNHCEPSGFQAFVTPLPSHLPGGLGLWSGVTIGSVRYLILDSNQESFELRTSMDAGGPQRRFIDAELARPEWRAARWRVALWHAPAVTSLWYTSSSCYYEYYGRQNWVALMDRLAASGCDLVLSGHAHGLQMGAWPTAASRMLFVVTGGGGGALDGNCAPLPMLPLALPIHHYLVIEFGAGLVVQARRVDGSLIAEVRR